MTNNEFNTILKEKASFLANVVAVLGFLGTTLYFIYTKYIKADSLVATYEVFYLPVPHKQGATGNLASHFTEKNDSAGDTLLYTDYHRMIIIVLSNQSKVPIKDVEIPLSTFFYSDYPQGYYVVLDQYSLENPQFMYFNKFSTIVEFPEIKAQEVKRLYVYLDYVDEESQKLLQTEDNVYEIRQILSIGTENNFDHMVSSMVVNNKWIQVSLYIYFFFGLYYFIKHLLPFLIKLIPAKKQ